MMKKEHPEPITTTESLPQPRYYPVTVDRKPSGFKPTSGSYERGSLLPSHSPTSSSHQRRATPGRHSLHLISFHSPTPNLVIPHLLSTLFRLGLLVFVHESYSTPLHHQANRPTPFRVSSPSILIADARRPSSWESSNSIAIRSALPSPSLRSPSTPNGPSPSKKPRETPGLAAPQASTVESHSSPTTWARNPAPAKAQTAP
ncbi:hypothetical protein BKA56DRAFT_21055 [Ilyonectria sp. MPI-CAGE-AT-0026]|nr:hypothetical protein BKA56DRAFT_21055 [Ilyonectria sp. MPI-CAGE-AT-0026]